MTKRATECQCFVCIDDGGYKASLIVRKIYQAIVDAEDTKRGLLRVIDESGEDYVFAKTLFLAIELPEQAERKLAAAG